MKVLASFILLTLFTFSSSQNEKKERPFDEFVFSFGEECCDYLIKFTTGDTVFLQKRLPRPRQNYFTIAADSDNIKLDSFLNAINFFSYDNMYVQKLLQDGARYRFDLTKDTCIKWIYIYGDEGPKQLYDFANWLRDFKDRQKFFPVDSTINVGNLDYIWLPDVPPPPKRKNSR